MENTMPYIKCSYSTYGHVANYASFTYTVANRGSPTVAKFNLFLNQELTWFLIHVIAVHECLYVYVRVCVSAPKAMNN